MSIKVMTYVWENSEQKGSALLLLLAIADHAHDDGKGAYPTVQRLADKSRMTTRNVQLLLKRLGEGGEIVIVPNAGPHGANLYEIPVTDEKFTGEKFSGVKTTVGGGENHGKILAMGISPKPSVEPSENHHISIDEQRKELLPSIEEKSVWPDWYATLCAIPGFKVPLRQAQDWLDKKGVTDKRAEETGYALKGKWPGPGRGSYKDPWATFQHWVVRPPLNSQSGGQGPRRSDGIAPGKQGDILYSSRYPGGKLYVDAQGRPVEGPRPHGVEDAFA